MFCSNYKHINIANSRVSHDLAISSNNLLKSVEHNGCPSGKHYVNST